MNMKRMRGRNHRPNGGGGGGGGGFRNQQNGIPLNRNHVFDSSGPEMRVRGTAQQLYDKYQQLARDAFSNGDRVTGEAYYQHAEHYFRIISAINQAQGVQNPPGGQQAPGQERGFGQNPGHNNEHRRESQGEPQEGGEARPQQEFRGENRDNRDHRENRRFEPRQRPDRPERNDPRFRPESVIDPRIDISMALEAELAAATAEPAGLGEQPVLPGTLIASPPAPEVAARAIPIARTAPPAEESPAPPAATEAAPEAPAPRTPRPRGRPRMARPEPEAAKAVE